MVLARKEAQLKNKLSLPSVWGTIKEKRHCKIISTNLNLLVMEHADACTFYVIRKKEAYAYIKTEDTDKPRNWLNKLRVGYLCINFLSYGELKLINGS